MVDQDIENAFHLTEGACVAYRDGSLPPDDFCRADSHMAGCPACERTLRATTPAPRLPDFLDLLPEPLHLSYEQLIEAVEADGGDEDSPLGRHLTLCGMCRTELRELERFNGQLQKELGAMEQVAQPPSRAWLRGLKEAALEFLATPARLRLATAGACLLALGTATMFQVQVRGVETTAAGRNALQVVRVAPSPHGGMVAGGGIAGVAGLLLLGNAIARRR